MSGLFPRSLTKQYVTQETIMISTTLIRRILQHVSLGYVMDLYKNKYKLNLCVDHMIERKCIGRKL